MLCMSDLGDGAFIGEQFTPQILGHMEHRLTVIDIAWSQIEGDQLALVVDHEIQLETVEPTHRVLAPGGQSTKHLVTEDASVVADGQGH